VTKAISAGFNTHLDLETTELTTCIYLRRRDGVEFRFTEFDVDIELTGDVTDARGRVMDGTYSATQGESPSSVDGSGALSVDNLDILTVLDSPGITEADMSAGLWDYADFNIFHVVHSDVSLGVLWLMSGKLGEVRMTRGTDSGVVELRSKSVLLQERIGTLVSHECPVDLGDHKCNVLGVVPEWADSTAYAVGDRVRSSVADRVHFVCTTAGTSDSDEPIWSIPLDTTTTDNAVTWTAYSPLKATEWTASRAYVAGDVVSATTFDKRRYVCTTAGTSDSSEPTWTTTIDATTADNTVVWTAKPALVWDGEVTSVTDRASFADSALVDAGVVTADWFKYGLLTWLAGNNAGIESEVKTSNASTGALTLWKAMPYTIQTSDTFRLEVGCDKAKDTCVSKFDNVVNFRGFPWVPGRDAVLQTPGSR
jgi:uncharacterized phage protein (TIGR02218 family)